MSHSWIHRVRLLALASLAALPSAAFGQAAAPPTEVLVPVQVAAAAQPVEVKARIEEALAAPASEYWIGVQLEPLPEIIVSQLKLERGMVVVQVFDDSPAAKAEFKVNDILLRAAGKDVKDPQDLITAVNDAKEKEIEIVALRGGTETTLKVTPAKRQADRWELSVSPETPHADVVLALEKLYQKAPDGDVRLLAVRPGAVYAYTPAAKFPSNLEITIEKRGDKPATIRVKRIQEGEDKIWEVTEDKLGDLPEDIRGHVQQLLGRPADVAPPALHAYRSPLPLTRTFKTEYELQLKAKPPGATPPRVVLQGTVASPADGSIQAKLDGSIQAKLYGSIQAKLYGSIQAKLDAILQKLDQRQGSAIEHLQKQIEQLRKEVDDLRQEKK